MGVLLFALVLPPSGFAAVADTQDTGIVSGTVATADGTPIAQAVVTLQGERGAPAGRTDAAGHFRIMGLEAGIYAIRVSANGYSPVGPRPIAVQSDASTDLTLTLARSSSSLTTIGRVVSNGGDTVSTSSTPVTTINPQAYSAEGYTRVSDVLQDDISTTLVHPAGGGSTVLPTSVALRGPDPTETLVDIDGHQVNSGDTGDFDLSLLDPADYGSIELVKGISPSSLVGPDTIDGAINIRTLEPTQDPHGLLRLSAGSFNSFAETLQTTGTTGRLGYAISLHRTTSTGEVSGPVYDANTLSVVDVGSGVDGSTALGKLRFAFGTNGGGYAELSFHDQSVTRDLSAALSSFDESGVVGPPGLTVVDGFAGSTLLAHNAGYGLDVRVPVGSPDANGVQPSSLLYRHYNSYVSQSVFGPAAETSPYLYNDRDLISEDSLEFDREFSNGSLTLQYSLRNESLTVSNAETGTSDSGFINLEAAAREQPGIFAQALAAVRFGLDDTTDAGGGFGANDTVLGQTQRAAVLRYIYDPTATLHLTAAAYYSDYSIFGHELDPRFGFVYTPDSRTALRFSVGSTYQAPQLPELYVPSVLPPPVGGIITIGNPNLKPDHATEYGVGLSHVLETGPHRTEASVDLYRVNLRNPASTYLPNGLQYNSSNPSDPNCQIPPDTTPCPVSYPVNAGDGVYQGVELSVQRRLAAYVTARAGYAVRSAYLTNVPPYLQDGTLVLYEQAQGLPLQKGTFAITSAPPRGMTYRAMLVYEGNYNELNEPPFATLAASAGYRWKNLELVVSGTNLTNVYDQHFINTGNGVPYGAIAGAPLIASDAYPLQGRAFNLSIARRF